MTAFDRMSSGYNPRWDFSRKAKDGDVGEAFHADIIDAIENGSAEVKRDISALKTGNVFIEYQCQYGGEWKNSGIATTEADLWCHVIGDQPAIVARIARLKHVAQHFYARFGGLELPPTYPRLARGVTVPAGRLLRHLALGFTPAEDEHTEQLIRDDPKRRKLPEGES